MRSASSRKEKKPPAKPRAAPPRQARRRLCILSRKRSLYSTSRLVEASRKAGVHPLVLDTLRCTLMLERNGPRISYRGAQLKDLEVAIPRIGSSITQFGIAVVNHLSTMGVPVVNEASAIARSRDKLRGLQLLAGAGIDIPRTVMARHGADIERMVEEVGGLPAIVKLLRGTQGVGVMLATTLAEVRTIVATFWDLDQEILIQEFVQESKGKDVRALVVGDEVVGAMRRTARKGEFRSNIHRGGEGKLIRLPRDYAATAVRAAKVIGLDVAGVDMLEATDGPKVMELNSSPGFEGLELATGKDIAGAIVAYSLEKARLSHIGPRPSL
jgi:ribosomal protein S6--L-glutamate ligase